LFLAIKVAALAPDAVHIAITIERDAVVVVGLRAGIDTSPGQAFDALLEIPNLSLDVGEAVGFLLGCCQGLS